MTRFEVNHSKPRHIFGNFMECQEDIKDIENDDFSICPHCGEAAVISGICTDCGGYSKKGVEEMGWRINWDKLSNDKLLELWLKPERGSSASQNEEEIENILKSRGVVEERTPSTVPIGVPERP